MKFDSIDLAEDFGIQIGDGYIKRQTNGYTIVVSGHRSEDEHYLVSFVKPLKEKLYNVKVKVYEAQAAGTLILKIDNKNLYKFYIASGLKESPKINIEIPKFIIKSKKLQIACLRGLMDTDGSLSFIKGDRKQHSYPTIHFATKSRPLAKQVCRILDNLKFTYFVQFDAKHYHSKANRYYIETDIYIYGKENLDRWMKIVGFHNIVQITRYLVYKKLGYCPPKTTLVQRLKILKSSETGGI